MKLSSHPTNKWIKYIVAGLLAALFFSINFIPYEYNCQDRQTQLLLAVNEQPTYERYCANAMGFPLKWFTLQSTAFHDTSQNSSMGILVINGLLDMAVAACLVVIGWSIKKRLSSRD